MSAEEMAAMLVGIPKEDWPDAAFDGWLCADGDIATPSDTEEWAGWLAWHIESEP